MRWRCCGVLSLLLVVECVYGGDAEDAAKAFEELFGQQARKVQATRSLEDDVRFAATLLDSSSAVGDRKALQELLCEKALEYASRDPGGMPTAVRSAEKLLTISPGRRLEWQEKLLAAYERQYRRATPKDRPEAGRALLEHQIAVAEELLASGQAERARGMYQRALGLASLLRSPRRKDVLARAKAVTARLAAERLAKTLTTRVKTHPDDRAAREKLIRLHLVNMDNPSRAAVLCNDSVDKALRTCVLLAAMRPEDLSAEQCMKLGAWYEELAKAAVAPASDSMARRAAQHYRAFLAAHPAEDIQRLKTTLALARVEKIIGTSGVSHAPGGLPKRITLSPGDEAALELVLVPAGTFVMGSDRTDTTAVAHAHPAHRVKISRPFYLGVTEVTQAQYKGLVGTNPAKHVGDKLPVENVSWDEAVAFCRKLSAKTGRRIRLPTEAEWEFACRAGTKTKWSTGDTEAGLNGHAWHRGNSGGKTHPAGEAKPNSLGLCDMHGNVYEWCHDCFRSGYDTKARPVDPTGPARGTERVLRGGSFWVDAGWCRSASRRGYKPASQWSNVGFRIVAEASK